jgi:hypothetical protein
MNFIEDFKKAKKKKSSKVFIENFKEKTLGEEIADLKRRIERLEKKIDDKSGWDCK